MTTEELQELLRKATEFLKEAKRPQELKELTEESKEQNGNTNK